ncbi:hypothetical protein H0O02_05350 [Candidatus Micrarchaeota archaeon]|nr:hypothetical protein [Candidatus Micrarchaeota archaeon]
MELAVKDIAELVELDRKRIELELKRSYLQLNKNDEDSVNALSKSLAEVNSSIKDRASKIEKVGINFCLVCQEKISDINSKLSTFSISDQVDALTAKEGEVYELLKERGTLLKKNFEERENLAKLLILISQVTAADTKYRLTEVVKRGGVRETIILEGCGSAITGKLAALFGRTGIAASVSKDGKLLTGHATETTEIPFVIANKKVWVAAGSAHRLTDNLSNIDKLSPQLQWKNAQRQIMVFSETEEAEFVDLQRKYLELLREQDEILKEFKEEEKLAIKVS